MIILYFQLYMFNYNMFGTGTIAICSKLVSFDNKYIFQQYLIIAKKNFYSFKFVSYLTYTIKKF